MMKNMMKTACAIAVLAASTNVMAESVDVVVKGTIAPIACKANILGGGVIDYGVISPEALKADDFTNLPVKSTNLTITCDAPAKIALAVKNNRMGTVPGRPALRNFDYPTAGAKLFGATNAATLGLGMANEKAIGGWAAQFVNLKADNVDSKIISTDNSGSSWGTGVWMIPAYNKEYMSSIAKKDEMTPIAAKVFSYDINIEAYLNKSSELDITKPAALDGSATIELVYL
ncbi:DUF1120 domain-containing protein [Pantoea dispersa]|uniref:DUF1120 domain-containing protein n=1 Tax=Pantoea dispersa TaxID=59814 RepID=UPI0021F78BE0|nr:DUF1120 domain-containing protein [Pantoea dispersa]UYP73625.1 DUF1120 domain-containing protein [Pantoea dispersa]